MKLHNKKNNRISGVALFIILIILLIIKIIIGNTY